MKKLMKERDALDMHYRFLVTNLMRYEDVNIEYYSDSDLTKRIVTHPEVGDFKDKVETT